MMHANHREEIDKVYAGDIAAAVGLKDTTTGDTLCDEDNPVILESMEFPEPVIRACKHRNDRTCRPRKTTLTAAITTVLGRRWGKRKLWRMTR